MNLFGSAVRVNYGWPKMRDAGRPPGGMSCAGVATVDRLEARLDLVPIPGFHGIKEEFHRVRNFDSMPSCQSVNQVPARLAEPGNLARDDFLGSGRWCSIGFAPGETRPRPLAGRASISRSRRVFESGWSSRIVLPG